MEARTRVELHINGEKTSVDVTPRETLADVVRHDLHLTGTHVGCEHGICGACTVLVDGKAMRACLLFAVQMEGHRIETVESLATEGQLNDLQRAFSERHGLQCGFCTPGFLMLLTGYLREKAEPTSEEIRDVVSSNLCRCTGYQGILDAAADVVAAGRAQDESGTGVERPAEKTLTAEDI